MTSNDNNNWRKKFEAMMTDKDFAAKAASVVGDTRIKNTELMNKSAENYPALSVDQPSKQPLDLSRVPQMQQEQAARATMPTDSEDYSGVADLATRLYAEERKTSIDKANKQNNTSYSMTPHGMRFSSAASDIRAEEQAKNIQKVYGKVLENKVLYDAIHSNANRILLKAMEKNQSMTDDEKKKVYEESVSNQLNAIGNSIDKYLHNVNAPKSEWEWIAKNAVNSSIMGQMLTSAGDVEGGENVYRQQAMADYGKDASWWAQGLSTAGSLIMDTLPMSGITTAIAQPVSRATMWGVSRIGGRALQNSILGKVAVGMAGGSATLGGYNAVSTLATQFNNGYFNADELLSSTGHGLLLGGLTGGMAPWLRGVSAGMGKAGKVATMASGLTAEAGIFTGAELAEMENPYDLETIAQVFGKNVAVIGGLKLSNLPKTIGEYKQWYTEGKQSNFSDADYKVMADFAKANGYAADDAFTMSADGTYSRSVADRATGNRTLLTMTKLQGGKEQNLAIEMYNDPNVPLSLKTKIAAKMNLPAPNPVLPNAVEARDNVVNTYYEYREQMSDGTYVTRRILVDSKEMPSKRKARAAASEFGRTKARQNSIIQSEAEANTDATNAIVMARLTEQAWRSGTNVSDEVARMYEIAQRAQRGEASAEDIAYYQSVMEGTTEVTDNIKAEIKSKTGVDIDEVLKQEGTFNTAQDKALTMYSEALASLKDSSKPTTERGTTASQASIADYIELKGMGIEQTKQLLNDPTAKVAAEKEIRNKYALWLKYFDGQMSEEQLATRLGYNLDNTKGLMDFVNEETFFRGKAANRIAYNAANAAKRLLEQGSGGVRFTEDGKVKLQGVPYSIAVDESIVDRYRAAQQGSGENYQRIANDALKDIIRQSEQPIEEMLQQMAPDEQPIANEPQTEQEAVTQQMVDNRLAEIDTDLQGIEADGIQRVNINDKPVMIVKGRIATLGNGEIDRAKSSTEVAYIPLDENGRPIKNEQGKPVVEVGVKPSNVRISEVEQWRTVEDYKRAEEQRIRDNNRITDEAIAQVGAEDTEVKEELPALDNAVVEPKDADELIAMCDGDKALALDVAVDELAKAQAAKGKGASTAETIDINRRIRTYQQIVDRLSASEMPDAAAVEVEAEQKGEQAKAEPQVTDDMEFVYQQGIDENHEGMEPMQMSDGRYKWVGLQRGELTATMGERDVELLDGLAKKLGVAVIPIDVADSAVNGYYRDGNIYVNTNRGADWTMRWVAGHELLHDVAKKSPEAYDTYKQAVLDMWGSDYINDQVKQIIDDYAASGKNIDREQALTELVNDFGGELFNSRDGLNILNNILKDESRKGNVGFIDTIKKWWDNIKEFFGVSPYANEVEKKLADAYKSAMKVMADRMGKRKVVEQQELATIGGLKDEAVADDAISNEGAEMSIVRDRNKIEELEGEELVPMFRTFQILDGALYSPMAAIQRGKKVHSVVEGDWWKADENADLAQVKVKGKKDEFYDKDDDRISKKDGQWVITIDGEDKPLATNGNSLSYYFNLKKGEKGDVVTDDLDVSYNPYIHSSKSALNDQFKGAYLRPNLVLVEVLVPKSELDGTNRYKADYAKDGIGEVDWNSGTVIKQAVAAGHPGRKVALSRYAKIGKVFTNAEWADKIDEELSAYKGQITLPFIAFPPDVLRGLANKGYKVEPPTSKKAQPYYEAWLKGEEPTDSNGGGKPTEEFSIKADKELEKKSLVGVHNLTEDNLRYALNLGGLANPSTAVIDRNIMGLEGFGDISLIMPKSLVAKSTGKNAGTFAGDAYTPRFPKGDVVKYITKEGEKAIRADYPGDDKFSKDFREAWQSYGNEYGGITPTLYYMYKLENGGAKIVKAEAPKIKSKEHQRMIDKFGNKEWYELNDAEKRELVDYRKSEMIESLKGADKNMVDKVVNDFINSADPEDLAYKKLRMLKMDYKEQQKAGEIDYMATYRNAQDDVALAGEQAKFNKWLADKSKRYGIEDRIFRGYTASGNRKYAPMTLANISKVMKEQGRAGAETFMAKSAYSLRGKMLPVYKTLEQIKKNKSKLADTETYEKFRKEIGDEYNELILDISELPNVKYDDTHYILEDALLKGFDYAEKQAGVQISDAVRERISAFGNLLKEAPVKYFETKFERPVMFDEFVAAVVPKNINPELRKALADKGLAIEEYERGSEESRLEAVRRASDRDDVQFSVKGKRADESVLDYAKRMSEETGKKNLLNGGSYFSGGGLLEEGLKGIVDPRIAVEYNQKVAGVYRNNFGEHIVTADVRDVDPAALVKDIDGPVAYFHASPVCKNFSNAKRNAEELPLDKETAQSTAKFIGEVRPKIVTIENVKGYRGSDAMKIILDELKKQGYNYDVDVYNAADYGAYTSRERLIVRAVRDWPLPPKPIKMLADERPSGWLEAVADIIDTLPEKKGGVAKWMDERLMAMGIDYRNIDKPLYVFGSGYSKDKIGYAFADELVPTLRTKGGDVIVMPDGRVLKATPRVLARISGMSDEYEMPKTDDLAHTIVGNGIPVQLTKAVMGSLIENVKSDLDAGNTEYSIIGKRGAANLDKRDETSIRVDNMVTAEEMEKAGKDAKTIRMATGWERGADGKWRYEVNDLYMLPFREWIGMRGKKLKDIVENAEEIFAAYPELADVKIKEGNGKFYGGSYSDGTITLDTYLAKLWMKHNMNDMVEKAEIEVSKTLIHEIQHYIQEKEGFAAGGNEGMILNKDAVSEIDALISDSNKLAVQYNDMIAKGVYEGREAIKEKIISLRAEANAIKKKNVIGAEGYRSLAGEVEARNAEFRSNMTDKERANTMLADTEDVAREDQIFLPDDLSKNAKGDYSIKQPKDAEYEAKEQWRKDNAGAITSSFFADRRADKAAEVEQLKKKISELKADNTKAASESKTKVREIADEMHAYIKKNIPTENQGDMTRQQFESVLKQLETAVTKKDLEKPMQMIEYIGTNVTRKSLTRQMRTFLKSEFKSMTPQGAVKAKTVDGATSRVLELAKTMYATMNKLPLGGEVAALQKQMRDLKTAVTEWATDQSADTKNLLADVLKVTERPAATRYNELAELRNKVAADGSASGEMLGYIDHMLDIMGDIDYFRGEQQKAKEASALNSKEDLEALKSELLDKSDKGILSEEDKAVLDNMPLYEMMVNLRQQQLDIDGGGAASIDAQIRNKQNAIKVYRAKMNELPKTDTTGRERYKALIEQVGGEIDDLFASRIVDQKAVNNGMRELIDDLVTLKEQGHSRLVEWSKGKQERSNGIRKLANDSFSSTARGYWDEVNKKGHRLRDINNFLNNAKLTMISPALSFEYMLGTLDKKYYTNDSPIYNRFIKSQDGLLKANDNFFEGLEAYNKEVNEAANRLIGRGAITNVAEWFKLGDRFVTEEIPFAFEVDQMFDDGTVRKVTKGITATMTRGQAAKIYAWSRMADGMAKLKAHGVTDETLAAVKDFIGEGYMRFVDWVEDDFFPRLRREKYNPKYKEIYGISMAENEHYFPFAIYKKDVRTNTDLEQIGDDKLGGGLVGNLIERKRNNARLDFTRKSPDIFDMITRYGETMEEWTAYAQVREDLKAMVNDKQFKVKCDMFGTDYYKHFLEAARVASRTSDDKALAGKWNTTMSKLQKVLASSAISMRVSTALKQLLSAPAFAVYSLDPKFLHQLEKTVVPIDVESAIKGLFKIGSGDLQEAKKLLLTENWVGHYNWCVNNLPSFRERVSLGGAGNPILEEKSFDNSFGKLCDAVQSAGMIPNRLVDAFTCSVGAKAVYEYNFNRYKKMYGEKAAHNMAVTEAEIAFNSSQQSSNPVFLSPMQVSKQFFLRGLMNFKNSPIGYLRAGLKANTDIVRAIKSIYNPTFKVDGQEMRFNSNGKNATSMLMTAATRSAMYNFFLNFIWNLGTVGIAGLSYTAWRNLSGEGNEDGNLLYSDEEWKKATGDNLASTLFLCATQGLPYISGPFATAEQGTEFAPLMLLNTLNEMGTDIYQSGLVSPVTAQWITNLALKNGAGIDPQVCARVYEGLQGILADRPVTEEDIMNLLASPRSAISGMTKQKVGEYDRLRDYVDARIKSNREIGIDERMDFGKALAGKRELRKSNLDYYIDEYLEANIPGYREISGRKSKETKQEEQANKKLYEQSMSLVEKIVGNPKGEADEQKASKIDSEDYDTKYKVRRLRDAVAAIHKLYAAGDYSTAEDIAAEMQRRIERGYDPNGKTLDERLKNVDIWKPAVEVTQKSADGYSTNFDRAIGGEFKKMYVGKMNGEGN